MSMCPWCKSNNPAGVEVCLKCGKKAADHPSVAGHEIGDAFGGGSESGAPPPMEIELATPNSGGQGGADVGGGGALKSFGDDWGEEAPDDGPALDIEAIEMPSRGRLPAPATASPRDVASAGKQPVSRASSGQYRAARPGQSGPSAAEAPALEVDAYEVLALADYGATPKSIVHVVPYAIRVKLRQRELRRALAGVRAALKESESRRDERFIELGELLRPQVDGNPEFGAFTSTLTAAEKTKQTRERALAEASSTFRERAAVVDAEIVATEAPLAAAKKEAETKSKLAEDAESLRQKHEARSKRVEIDVRAARATLARPETLMPQRQQAQALIAAASAERDQRALEEQQAAAVAQDAESRAVVARQRQEELEHRVAALHARRRELEKEFARQGQIRSQGIDAASKEVRHALLEIGRRTVSAPLTAEGADMRRKAIAEAEGQVKRLQLDLERHLRALDAAHEPSVRNGLIILALAVVVFLGSFTAWRLLRSNPYLPPTTPTAPSK